jgi:hypothetical protein
MEQSLVIVSEMSQAASQPDEGYCKKATTTLLPHFGTPANRRGHSEQNMLFPIMHNIFS